MLVILFILFTGTTNAIPQKTNRDNNAGSNKQNSNYQKSFEKHENNKYYESNDESTKSLKDPFVNSQGINIRNSNFYN